MVKHVVELLVAGEFDAAAQITGYLRLSAEDIAEAIRSYGRIEPGDEALQVGRSARPRLRQPAIEALEIAVSHQAEQAQRQFTRDSNCRLDGAENLHGLMAVTVLARRELALLLPQHPRTRAAR